MRRFNPEKELRKIQKENKNKVIVFVFLLLIVSVVSYSFALYQVRYSKRIIYTKVAPFSSKDLDLAVYLNGEKQNMAPEKNSGYKLLDMICDIQYEGIPAWDDAKALLSLPPMPIPNKCNVYLINDDYNESKTFEYNEEAQEYTIPKDGLYKIELWGAQGGGTDGGKGAYTKGYINLKKDEKLYFYVGGAGTGGKNAVYAGGYNGGGSIVSVNNLYSSYRWNSYSGGGATDVRLTPGAWNDFDSLKSRIMVAGGGGGGSANVQNNNYVKGGSGGTLNGEDGKDDITANPTIYGTGGTQIKGGVSVYNNTSAPGTFGKGGDVVNAVLDAGGGGGYYGGGGTYLIVNLTSLGGGGGGSSFISGYTGCNAIDGTKSTSATNIVHTGEPNHYSGKVFTNSTMISGDDEMPNYNGEVMTGNTGNGMARITLFE